MLDDHDKIIQGNNKSRFCAFDEGDQLIIPATATNLMTLGIPCIYYGSEQQFDGNGSGDGDGTNFGPPSFVGGATRISSVIAWSRLLDNEEFVMAINTDTNNDLEVWVTIDNTLHNAGDKFTCLYPGDPCCRKLLLKIATERLCLSR
jgi:hypothetical protein